MGIIISRFRFAVAAAALLALVSSTPALGQQAPPDVRGSYFTSGAASIYACTFGEVNSTIPISEYLIITDQDGAAIIGEIGSLQESAIHLVGQISDDGSIAGTWTFTSVVPDPDGQYHDQVFTGQFAGGKVAIELTATVGNSEASCQYRIALSSDSVLLSWSPPDPAAAEQLPPPRALTATAVEPPSTKADPRALAPNGAAPSYAARTDAPRDAQPTGYNVYRSMTPGVPTTPENLFTSVPATQTSVPAPDGTSGSFFVVTATYDAGESGPSNEVSGGVAAATLASVKVSAAKIVAKGADFSHTVQVFVDGIPFASPAKVKAGKKVTQKGALLTGQSLAQYVTSGKTVAISFRNENGGVATFVYTKP